MSGLTKKVKCEWCRDGLLSTEFRKKYPQSCPWCQGTGEQEMTVYLQDYKGSFHNAEISENGIYNYQEDIWIGFNCPCGEEMSVIDEAKVCKCGRIYRLQYTIDVDETHIGEIDWLIQESNKEK